MGIPPAACELFGDLGAGQGGCEEGTGQEHAVASFLGRYGASHDQVSTCSGQAGAVGRREQG